MGNELTMYIGNSDAVAAYSNIGAEIFGPTVYTEMMKGLTKYKWGWIGFNNPDNNQRQVNMTLTNKFWEYLAAGLPVIVYGAPETARLAQELGVGIVLENLDDLGNVDERFGDLYPQLKRNVEIFRKVHTMENNIWKIENLYREVLYKNKG